MCTHVELVAVMMNKSNPLLINDKQLTADVMIEREGGREEGRRRREEGRKGGKGEGGREREDCILYIKNINILEDSNVQKSGRRKQGS